MSDIFNEVDEEVRREKLKKLWDRYQVFIIGGAILIVAPGRRLAAQSMVGIETGCRSGRRFPEPPWRLSAEGKHAEAEAAFAKVAEEGVPPVIATLPACRQQANWHRRDPKAAVEVYDALAADSRLNDTMRDLAAVFAAASFWSIPPPMKNCAGVSSPRPGRSRPFRNSAREILALSALRGNDPAAARKWLDQIVTDVAAPAGLRQRIEMLMALAPDAGNS